MSGLEFWQAVCPDGKVRHYPYVNDTVARYFARAFSEHGCRQDAKMNKLEAQHPPCPGGEHTVRRVPSVESTP